MPETLWALTVHQPWATAIIWAGKNVENRAWPTKYRGPLLIHASKKHCEYDDYCRVDELTPPGVPLSWANTRGMAPWAVEEECYRPHSASALGVILGVVDVVGCHLNYLDELCGYSGNWDELSGMCSPWAAYNQWHFELANPRPFTRPVPAIGKQRAWKVTGPTRDAVLEQLEA